MRMVETVSPIDLIGRYDGLLRPSHIALALIATLRSCSTQLLQTIIQRCLSVYVYSLSRLFCKATIPFAPLKNKVSLLSRTSCSL
jgi:hypothetical protein